MGDRSYLWCKGDLDNYEGIFYKRNRDLIGELLGYLVILDFYCERGDLDFYTNSY